MRFLLIVDQQTIWSGYPDSGQCIQRQTSRIANCILLTVYAMNSKVILNKRLNEKYCFILLVFSSRLSEYIIKVPFSAEGKILFFLCISGKICLVLSLRKSREKFAILCSIFRVSVSIMPLGEASALLPHRNSTPGITHPHFRCSCDHLCRLIMNQPINYQYFFLLDHCVSQYKRYLISLISSFSVFMFCFLCLACIILPLF